MRRENVTYAPGRSIDPELPAEHLLLERQQIALRAHAARAGRAFCRRPGVRSLTVIVHAVARQRGAPVAGRYGPGSDG